MQLEAAKRPPHVEIDDQPRNGDREHEGEDHHVGEDDRVEDVADESERAGERVVEEEVDVDEPALLDDFADEGEGGQRQEQQEDGEHPADRPVHFAVEIVREHPVGDVLGPDRTDVLQPVALAECREAAGAGDHRPGDEIADRQRVGIAVVRRGVVRVDLLAVLDPDRPPEQFALHARRRVEVEIVLSSRSAKAGSQARS